tara:strand:+ start:3993 stop:4736 length:744 start_codon:yes stop_codon:yes gene_type:complete
MYLSHLKKMKVKNTILIYSGGLDSTVLLCQLLSQGIETRCLSIDYGQKHKKELQSASEICNQLKVEHKCIDLSSLNQLFQNSSLINENDAIPEGHYEQETMKATVVPNRNMILLSLATAWAISTKSTHVSYAAHAGDHAIYPDCRESFAQAMNEALNLCDWNSVQLHRPFVNLTKADICKLGNDLSVPFTKTWSCYKGGEHHCGRCGTCIERREAFHLAGVEDRTPYSDDAPTIEQMLETNWKLIEE